MSALRRVQRRDYEVGAMVDRGGELDRDVANGTQSVLEGKPVVFYDGYWIRYYEPPDDELGERQRLIEHLTRRAFHHTEPGINTPGNRLEEARTYYEAETDPARKRVNAAMLAGALFNRTTDIFHSIVELRRAGVSIGLDNELMKLCGNYLREAMELGKQVKHHSGEEGIDELWGEPLKAFTMPVPEFYVSRYVKIAQAMRNIDQVAQGAVDAFTRDPAFIATESLIYEFSTAAKLEAETMRSDPAIFQVWPKFVSAAERLSAFCPTVEAGAPKERRWEIAEGLRLLLSGKELLTHLAGARVPMPSSTRTFLSRCADYAAYRAATC